MVFSINHKESGSIAVDLGSTPSSGISAIAYNNLVKNLDSAMNKVLWQSLAHNPWDHAKEDNFWQQLRENALYLKNNTDKALISESTFQ